MLLDYYGDPGGSNGGLFSKPALLQLRRDEMIMDETGETIEGVLLGWNSWDAAKWKGNVVVQVYFYTLIVLHCDWEMLASLAPSPANLDNNSKHFLSVNDERLKTVK